MSVSDFEWISKCKRWGSAGVIRDIGTDKGPGILAGKEEIIALGVVPHGG